MKISRKEMIKFVIQKVGRLHLKNIIKKNISNIIFSLLMRENLGKFELKTLELIKKKEKQHDDEEDHN